MAQLVEHPNSTLVRISRSMGSSPVSVFVLTAQSLELASDSVSPSPFLSLSLSRLCSVSVSVSLSKVNIKFFLNKEM